jgi:predicted RNA-binding protein YlxR (DUF448 family)
MREEPVERTCVGCGGKADPRLDPAGLVRLAAPGGRLQLDAGRRLGGRGAWLHRSPACLERALGRRALPRALRQDGLAVDAGELGLLLTGVAPKV